MFVRLSCVPLGIEPDATANLPYELTKTESGWLLTVGATAASVRRRLLHEVVVPRHSRFLLEDGDTVWAETSGLFVQTERVVRELELERRAVEDWENEGAWGVLGDALQDRGEPIGEQLATCLRLRSHAPIGPHTWIGADWHHGVLRRVVLSRPEWSPRVPWREALLELLCARSSRFIEECTLDLPRLEPHLTPLELTGLARELLALPWPTWLRRLRFGVAPAQAVASPEALLVRCPRLERAPLFVSGAQPRLVLERSTDALTVEGLQGDTLAATEGLRLRVFPNRVLFERPTWPRYDSWPSWDFSVHDGRVFLTWRHGAPRSDDVRINGMEFFNAALVPGDRIEIMGQISLRFECD